MITTITPISLNSTYLWSFGFFAGFMLFNQTITGLFLAMYYVIALFIFINKIMVNEKKIEYIKLICQKQGIFFYGLHLLMYIINKVVLYKIKKKCLNIY